MREIKFRAWDDNLEIWHVFTAGQPSTVKWLGQFTGLKDKNGKEIYDGDIFQCRSGDNKADMQGDIYFDEGCFRMRYGYQSPGEDQRKDYFLSSVIGNDGAKKIEVIGTVWENPELLTV